MIPTIRLSLWVMMQKREPRRVLTTSLMFVIWSFHFRIGTNSSESTAVIFSKLWINNSQVRFFLILEKLIIFPSSPLNPIRKPSPKPSSKKFKNHREIRVRLRREKTKIERVEKEKTYPDIIHVAIKNVVHFAGEWDWGETGVGARELRRRESESVWLEFLFSFIVTIKIKKKSQIWDIPRSRMPPA